MLHDDSNTKAAKLALPEVDESPSSKKTSNENDAGSSNNTHELKEQKVKTTEQLIEPLNNRTLSKKPILIKTLSFGINGFFFSSYIVGNSKIMALLGEAQASAGSLISPYQSVLLGASVGFVLCTGIEVGTYVGKNQYILAGDVAKSAWILTFILGGISSIGMILPRLFFPLIFNHKVASEAAAFFLGCSIGNIPMLMLVTNSQIAFQEGDWFFPPAVGFALFVSATSFSYVLALNAHLGAFGVGLGGSIAQFTVFIVSQLWFLKSSYDKYELFKIRNRSILYPHIKKLLNLGWKLSLARLTEWGNLLAISTVIGIENNTQLEAASPSEQYINVIAASLQGIAQATGMMISQNNGAKDKALESNNIQEAVFHHKKNIRTLIINNFSAIGLNSSIALIFYFNRESLANFFLSDSANSEIRSLASTFLVINIAGLIPDATRLIITGALRAGTGIRVLYPIIVSLITMIVIGVPAGFGLGKIFGGENEYDNKGAWMFYARNIAMLASAIVIARFCYKGIQEDKEKIFNPGQTQNNINQPLLATSTSNSSEIISLSIFKKSFLANSSQKLTTHCCSIL